MRTSGLERTQSSVRHRTSKTRLRRQLHRPGCKVNPSAASNQRSLSSSGGTRCKLRSAQSTKEAHTNTEGTQSHQTLQMLIRDTSLITDCHRHVARLNTVNKRTAITIIQQCQERSRQTGKQPFHSARQGAHGAQINTTAPCQRNAQQEKTEPRPEPRAIPATKGNRKLRNDAFPCHQYQQPGLRNKQRPEHQ